LCKWQGVDKRSARDIPNCAIFDFQLSSWPCLTGAATWRSPPVAWNDDFVARPKRLALCESTTPALWAKSCPKVTLCQLQPCIKRTAPQTRVSEVQNLDLSGLLAGCTLHTCSRNTTNSGLERRHFAHVFWKYDEFGARAPARCTRVREIRRIRRSSGCTLHTCSRNTTNSVLERLHFTYVFEEYDEFGARAAV
jgi:hypothetical protein